MCQIRGLSIVEHVHKVGDHGSAQYDDIGNLKDAHIIEAIEEGYEDALLLCTEVGIGKDLAKRLVESVNIYLPTFIDDPVYDEENDDSLTPDDLNEDIDEMGG